MTKATLSALSSQSRRIAVPMRAAHAERPGQVMRWESDFDAFFRAASGGRDPFPYQRRIASADTWPARIEVPTGLGKTLAVVVGWLWHRQRGVAPRRLVYCLPMRVLVEQTRDVARDVVSRLGLSTRIVVLMGGVDEGDGWDIDPASDAIVIGTQDMLLSRALQRGYGMSRYRWPLHFGLLNNDCLWIIDEVQLVGTGVATTAQLQALRRKLGTLLPTRTSWMSATMEESWIRTVDVDDADLSGHAGLDEDDRADPVVSRRIGAVKALVSTESRMGDAKGLAREIVAAHRPGTRTLIVVNTVERAKEVWKGIVAAMPAATTVLLHSRFRRFERDAALMEALAAPREAGTIVVSTQVIEAGVDVTSTTLFTEVAPWPSLVQRFGRCNRGGEDAGAEIRWIPLPDDGKLRAKLAPPYSVTDLDASTSHLQGLTDVGPSSLPRIAMDLERGLVLRRRDVLDLFDTTPDLMGNDVDVSRFIREADDQDVRVCWRDIDEPDANEALPGRDELCAAHIGVARLWKKDRRAMWTWDALGGRWVPADRLYPGLTLLLRARDGGYDPQLGLDVKSTRPVEPIPIAAPVRDDRQYDSDPESEWREWYLLSHHSDDVVREARSLAAALALPEALATALVTAGRWHDAGKAHPVWQKAAKVLGVEPPLDFVAKSQARRGHIRCERPGFRHELASALLALSRGQSDLVCFLIACHHGKVRLSLRALPIEKAPTDEQGHEAPSTLHARGIWEGDRMPAIDLGDGLLVDPTTLTLRYMLLGYDEVTGASWASRTLALRDDPNLGPFRLGFLEALIKCADERASSAEGTSQ